ncbi:MAG: DUF2829 domain-containing protein [Bacillota bacterium]|nr:DUF2829 domain-containing protein [Bacillota bacterium]
MLFAEALKALHEGEYLAREIWTGAEYIVHMPGMQYLWKILTQPNPNAGNWVPLVEDMIAEDWKIIQQVQPATPAVAPSA